MKTFLDKSDSLLRDVSTGICKNYFHSSASARKTSFPKSTYKVLLKKVV